MCTLKTELLGEQCGAGFLHWPRSPCNTTYDSERASYRARNGVVVGPLTEDYHVSAAQSLLRLQLHFAFGSPCDFDGSIALA